MQTLFEHILLYRIQKLNDPKAFEALYDRYAERITRFISMKLGDPETVDELVNDVFFKAWKYFRSDEPIDHVQAVLFRIARTVVADHYRGKVETVQLDEAGEKELGVEPRFQKAVDDAFRIENLKKALGSLKESYREAVVLRYFEELSIEEIAQALGKTPGTVRVLIHRAVGALEKIIGNEPTGSRVAARDDE